MSDSHVLTQSEADKFRMIIPDLIRAVLRNEPLDPSIHIVGMGTEGAKHLCYPLTPAQLDRIHRCTAVRTRTVDVTCHTDFISECKGVLTFHVAYDFEGAEVSGGTLTIREQGWIFVFCKLVKKQLYITGVEGYPHDVPLPDKVATPSGELPPSSRKARERLHKRAASDVAKSCCWDTIIDLLFGWF